jgi:hypothetical protein
MSLSVTLLLWLFLAGAATLVALAWATLAALAEAGRLLGLVLLGLTGCLAAWPAVLSQLNDGVAAPYALPLLAGTALILAAALVALARLRRHSEARLPARIAVLTALHYLAVMAAAVFWPG